MPLYDINLFGSERVQTALTAAINKARNLDPAAAQAWLDRQWWKIHNAHPQSSDQDVKDLLVGVAVLRSLARREKERLLADAQA